MVTMVTTPGENQIILFDGDALLANIFTAKIFYMLIAALNGRTKMN